MASALGIAAATGSIALRLLAYVFFRWIPGHPFPPCIYACGLAYYACIYLEGTGREEEGTEESGRKLKKEGSGTLQQRKAGYPSWWKTWLLGLPTPNAPGNWIALSINAVLVLLTLDVVYTGPLLYPSNNLSFARLGYVSSTSASILVREPDPSKLPIYLTYRIMTPPGSWRRAGVVLALQNATDYTAPLTLEHLEPDTQYAYTLSNNHSGTFTTAPPTGSVPSTSNVFTFLTTSCIKSGFPYSPTAHRLNIPGLDHLAALLPELKVQFMLFLGDFIYIDVPHFHSSSVENYRSEYRRVYSSPSWPGVASLPWLHVWDDHEIKNDWDKGSTAPYPAARDPFNNYHHAVNPLTPGGNKTWYTFHSGPASFFLLDTRSYRSPSSASSAIDEDKTMLGASQLSDLLTWLHAPEPQGVRWKFLVSSIPFTRNWRVNAMDTWGGYLAERKKILNAMWDIPHHSPGTGVVVLSGDRHEFAATRFPAPLSRVKGADVIEFSTSPLSMFYLPIRTYRADTAEETERMGERYGHDEVVEYVPDGNSKFGAVEMDEARDARKPAKLRFRLYVDGRERWVHEMYSPCVEGKVRGYVASNGKGGSNGRFQRNAFSDGAEE